MKKALHYIWQHKFLWTSILFVVIVGFIDENSIWNRYEMKQINDSLRHEIKMCEDRCRHDSLRLEQLKHDPCAIDHVAREVYFMKRPDEDVYIVN